MNPSSSSSKPTQSEELQMQCKNGRNEEDKTQCSQGDASSDQPTDTSLRVPQGNNELGLYGMVGTKRAQGIYKFDYTYSHGGSFSIDRFPDQNLVHSLLVHEQYSLPAPNDVIAPTTNVISRRELLPISETFTRNTNLGASGASQSRVFNVLGSVGSMVSRSQSSSNFRFQTHPTLYRYWISRGLNNVIRSSSIALGYTSNNSVRNSQGSQTSSVFADQNEPRNEVDLLRHQYEQTVLFVHMLDNGSAEGSLSLRITTARNGRQREHGVLVLGQSPLFNIIDLQDHYEDMRLDVENMSYEELLDLEDRIGNVSTGLSDEAIKELLKLRKYFLFSDENALKESCIICQEDYIEEDELGTLSCGHDFHHGCIIPWLRCKNICPICKTTGLTTSDPSIATST